MTLLGNANWWAPRFLRRAEPVPDVEPERDLELVGA